MKYYQQHVQKLVTPQRYAHIVRVMVLTHEISKANHFSKHDRARAQLAALLHDAARDLFKEDIFALCPPQNDTERNNPMTLHGQAGAILAKRWGVRDQLVLDAISGHVFGVDPHNHIGMAVYIADISEPARGVNEDIRALAMDNLYEAYERAVACKVHYLQSIGKTVHPRTLAAYQAINERKTLEQHRHSNPRPLLAGNHHPRPQYRTHTSNHPRN